MLYDLASAPPEPGSLLESILLLVSLRRREAELYQTELLVTSIISAQMEGEKRSSAIQDALADYKNALFPFLEAEKFRKDEETKKIMEYWGDRVFKVRPLWQAGKDKKIQSRLRRAAEHTADSEKQRRASALRKI